MKDLKNPLVYIKNYLIDSDDNMYLTVKDINNIVIGSNNITLRKVNVMASGHDKMYMDKDLIEDKLYQLVDQFNERKINHRNFYSESLDNVHPFCDGNRRTCLQLSIV